MNLEPVTQPQRAEVELRKIAAVLDLVLLDVQTPDPAAPWLISVRLGVRRNLSEVVAAGQAMREHFAARALQAGFRIQSRED